MPAAHNRVYLGSSPRGPTKRRIDMNPYEEAELGNRDLTCEICWKIISTKEFIENEGICDQCAEELPKE